MNKPNKIIIHHSGGTDANLLQDSSNYTVNQCNIDHQRRFNMKSLLGWYVGYHYFIDKYGIVTRCRADDEEGAHTIGQNLQSIGICLAGNFDVTLPTNAQMKALNDLVFDKQIKYGISDAQVFPHRHFASKTCYGKLLPDDWATFKSLNNMREYSIQKGIIKGLSGALLVGLPIIAGALPQEWMNVTLGGLLIMLLNYLKFRAAS